MERAPLTKKQTSTDLPTAQQQLFIGTVVSLTWQLLVVVLVPFIGGHYLDTRYDTAPLWTLIGLGVALLLASLATYRGYQTLSAKSEGSKHV